MKHGRVTDGDPPSNVKRQPGVGVEDGAVLDVAFGLNGDLIVIPPLGVSI